MTMTEEQLRALAESWRTGASDLRNERQRNGKVPPEYESAAMVLESCAARLEVIAKGKP